MTRNAQFNIIIHYLSVDEVGISGVEFGDINNPVEVLHAGLDYSSKNPRQRSWSLGSYPKEQLNPKILQSCVYADAVQAYKVSIHFINDFGDNLNVLQFSQEVARINFKLEGKAATAVIQITIFIVC